VHPHIAQTIVLPIAIAEGIAQNRDERYVGRRVAGRRGGVEPAEHRHQLAAARDRLTGNADER
jgi:hypothetical protein